MSKQYSIKFWLSFWLISLLLLAGWFFYWNTKNKGVSSSLSVVVNILPIDQVRKNEFISLAKIGDFMLKKDGQEKTFLVLFQNNLELRPGGGFLGAFAVVKIKDGRIISMQTKDLSTFDAQILSNTPPPYPIGEVTNVTTWKMRDSNFSPDFPTDAAAAEEFYALGGGQEKIDGVFGITANTLTSMLRATGPIQIEGYPGTYDSENAIIALEYQVEKAFEQQGIDRVERKSVINELAGEIEKRIQTLNLRQKIALGKILIGDLNKKDIQLYFNDPIVESAVQKANWAGNVDQNWKQDYLMISDANLGSFKSDYYIKRGVDYTIDMSSRVPIAHLKITYQHTANQKDWMTRDYLTYLRIYVPEGSWYSGGQNFIDPKFGNEFGKKYFGALVKIPIGETKTVDITYTLPSTIDMDKYTLKIQKQAGISDEPVVVHVINKDGSKKDINIVLNNSDTIVTN